MKAGKEQDLVRAILDLLKLRGVFAWRQNTGGVYDPGSKRFRTFHGMKGVADILAVLAPGGRLLALEVKTPRGIVSPEQAHFLDCVQRNGGYGYVVRSVSQMLDILDELGVP